LIKIDLSSKLTIKSIRSKGS